VIGPLAPLCGDDPSDLRVVVHKDALARADDARILCRRSRWVPRDEAHLPHLGGGGRDRGRALAGLERIRRRAAAPVDRARRHRLRGDALDSIAAATGLHELQHIRVVNGRMADVSALLADDLRAWSAAGADAIAAFTVVHGDNIPACLVLLRWPSWQAALDGQAHSMPTRAAARRGASAGSRVDKQPFAARNACSVRNSRSRRWRDQNAALEIDHETGDGNDQGPTQDRSWLWRGAGLATTLLAIPLTAALAQQPNVKVGLFLELTGGSASTTSEASQFGVELAVQEINAAGGIGGRKLQLVVADTQTDPTVGVGEIKRLVQQEKVEFVFGPVISQILLAAAPVMNEAKVGAMGSTGSLAITPKSAPYYFSTLINAETQAKHMAAQAGTC
jgi:hypothetical protein